MKNTIRKSLWSPPRPHTSTIGLRPTSTIALTGSRSSSCAHFHTSRIVPRLVAIRIALIVQNDAATPERHEREGQEREQRSVGAQQLVPVAERVARVGVRLEHGIRRVGVEMVDDLHAPVVDVVEDVRERHRGRQEEDHVRATTAAIVQRVGRRFGAYANANRYATYIRAIVPVNRYLRAVELRVIHGSSPPSGPAIQPGKKPVWVVAENRLGRFAASHDQEQAAKHAAAPARMPRCGSRGEPSPGRGRPAARARRRRAGRGPVAGRLDRREGGVFSRRSTCVGGPAGSEPSRG